MKKKKFKVLSPVRARVNVSIHRAVIDATGSFLDAVIVEFINHRFNKNDKKPVYLQIDWLHENLPYIKRSGLAKRLEKLEKDGHIVVKRGDGRHYHKCWYSPSRDMLEACAGKVLGNSGKVYFNLDVAEENLEASVVYAAIVSLLRMEEGWQTRARLGKNVMGRELGRVDDKLLLDYSKLVEGSGLSIGKVRKAVAWLIKNKKIEIKEVFGNKRQVWLPANTPFEPPNDLPTESFPHNTIEEDQTEY